MQAHSGGGRLARPHIGGLTIALLLVTALASLPAATENLGSGRMAERAGRAARTLQPDTILNTGFELVAIATLAGAVAPDWLDPRDIDAVVSAIEAPAIDRSAFVAAGLMNLPPPTA